MMGPPKGESEHVSTTSSRIGDLFNKDIHRDINGVIKVGQLDERNMRLELEEYILTRELRRYFDIFFSFYTGTLDDPTDQIGVWISGFFGSGKSHFLKILSYLLDNLEVAGKKAVDYFRAKIDDPMLMGALEQAAHASDDVILFNIDSKTDKEAIVKVFK